MTRAPNGRDVGRREERRQPSRPRLPDDGRGQLRMSAAPLGVYVHWPFCKSKCPYCDFNSHVRDGVEQARWRAALLRELEHGAREAPGRRVETMFFGGGTPSLMEPETVAALIARTKELWDTAPEIGDHAGGQSHVGRGQPLRGARRGRRQPGLAGRSGARRVLAKVSRPRAFDRRGAGGAGHGAAPFCPSLLRPDLCAAGPDARGLGRGAGARVGLGRRTSVALPAHHRTRDALLHRSRARKFCAAGRGGIRRHVRADSGAARTSRAPCLRDFQSCAAGGCLPP